MAVNISMKAFKMYETGMRKPRKKFEVSKVGFLSVRRTISA